MGSSAKGYRNIFLRRIGFYHPRVIYIHVEGNIILDILIESEHTE